MTFFYKELDLPAIPDELLNELPTTSFGGFTDLGYGYQHYKNGNKIYPCSYKWGRIDSGTLFNWLIENIQPIQAHLTNSNADVPNVFMHTTTPRHDSGGAHIVHSDFKRIVALNYHWSLGGDAVINRWYKENGKPLLRKKARPGGQVDSGQVKYDDLEILEEVIIKKNRWYLINVDCLHDVQNIISIRQGITVPFATENELDHAGFKEHP